MQYTEREIGARLSAFLDNFGSCTTHIVQLSSFPDRIASWYFSKLEMPSSKIIKKWTIFASSKTKLAIKFHNFKYLHADGQCSLVVLLYEYLFDAKTYFKFMENNIHLKRSASSFIILKEAVFNTFIQLEYICAVHFFWKKYNWLYYYCPLCDSILTFLTLNSDSFIKGKLIPHQIGEDVASLIKIKEKQWNNNFIQINTMVDFVDYILCSRSLWTLTKRRDNNRSTTLYIEKHCPTDILLFEQVFATLNATEAIKKVDSRDFKNSSGHVNEDDYVDDIVINGYFGVSLSNDDSLPLETLFLAKVEGKSLFYCFDRFQNENAVNLLGVWSSPFDIWTWLSLFLSMVSLSTVILFSKKDLNIWVFVEHSLEFMKECLRQSFSNHHPLVISV